MKRLLFNLLILSVFIGLFHACEKDVVKDGPREEMDLKSANSAKTSYIVVLDDAELNIELSQTKGYEMRQNAMKNASARIMKRAGVIDGEVELVYGTALKGFSVKIPPGQLSKLENDPSVVSVIEDQIVSLVRPGDDEVSATATQTTPWGITRVHGGATYSGTKKAWVIDTGIDLDHPDLNVNTSLGKSFVTTASTANDDNGHGTHVAGIIAAINNSEGVVGVAAGATVVPVKVLDRRGSGYYSWIIAGVNYVAANAAKGDVANMSLGGSYYKDINTAVINAAKGGVLFALAAGNESTSATTRSPASANHANIYTISAMATGDIWAYYSNYGNPPVDFCEPGSSIYSTYKDGGYASLSGTSMAAPHMAGILMWGDPVTEGYVKNDPDGNADPIGVVGGGVINQSPTANFTLSITELTVQFTDASTDSDGTVVGWSWNFGDGTTSTAQNPSHTYSAGGTYTVNLTVTDDDGATGTTSKSVTVTGGTPNVPPTASFTYSATDLAVNFTDTSTDSDGTVVGWSWNFGDGTTSTAQNPSHTYSAGGTYTVSLTVTDDDGATGSTSQSVAVTDPDPGNIILTATGYKIRGIRYVDLSWVGSTSNVDIYRNGQLLVSNFTSSSYTDDLQRLSGTFIYKVCETGTSTCSNEVAVTL